MRALLEKLALCKFRPKTFLACEKCVPNNACSARISKNARHLRCYPIKKSAFPCCPFAKRRFSLPPHAFLRDANSESYNKNPFLPFNRKIFFPWYVCVVISSRTQHIAKISIWHL